MKELITQGELKEIIHYDPFSGEFFRIIGPKSKLISENKTGPLGTIHKNGYRYLYFGNRCYPAHRLAWFYITGKWPNQEIDHKNRNRSDNSFNNIRLANRQSNSANSSIQKRNKTRLRGVFAEPRCNPTRWRSIIRKDKKQIWLGQFSTKELAARAYDSAARELFGEFAYQNYPLEK